MRFGSHSWHVPGVFDYHLHCDCSLLYMIIIIQDNSFLLQVICKLFPNTIETNKINDELWFSIILRNQIMVTKNSLFAQSSAKLIFSVALRSPILIIMFFFFFLILCVFFVSSVRVCVAMTALAICPHQTTSIQ